MMKVPDELVDHALETGFGIPASSAPLTRKNTRRALEAVLPKVRERLLSDEAIYTAVSLDGGEFIPEEQQGEEAAGLRISLAAAFDHAFPEKGS